VSPKKEKRKEPGFGGTSRMRTIFESRRHEAAKAMQQQQQH
jgi:hypothetical protein